MKRGSGPMGVMSHETDMGLGIEPWRPDSQPSNTASPLCLSSVLYTGYVAEFVYSLLTARAPKSKRDGLARKSKVSNPLWLSAKLLFLATSPALAVVDVMRVPAPPQMRGRTVLQAWLF